MNKNTLRKIIKEEIQTVLTGKPIVDVNFHTTFKCDINIKTLVLKFLYFIAKRLNINSQFTIILTKSRENLPTLAAFSIEDSSIFIYVKMRNVADVLRSIAHELVHKEQKDVGKFEVGDKIQDIGGTIENEANAKAGALVKAFSYSNREIYEMNFGE